MEMSTSLQQEEAEGSDDINRLVDRYPFTAAQIAILLEVQNLERATNDGYQLSTTIKVPSIEWVEENLLLYPFSDFIKYCDGTDFFESIASLTGRKGSPNFELITVYNLTMGTKGGQDIASHLMNIIYRIGLACHCIQHWGDDSLDLDMVKTCAGLENKSMIGSLQSFKREPPSQEGGSIDITKGGFLDWVDLYFPQMQCILSTYMHLVLFSTLSNERQTCTDDDKEDFEPCRTSLYALGNRTMFQFPTMTKLVMATQPDFHALAQRKIVANINVTSELIDDPDIMGVGGVIGHFAFGLALMDPKLCGKVSQTS